MFDKDDYSRREKIAEDRILEYALKTDGKEQFNLEFLKELCFCDDSLLSNVLSDLFQKEIIEQGELLKLTPKGIGYYKSLFSKDNYANNKNSRTVFIAQSFSPDMLEYFKQNIEPIVKDLGF